MKITIPDYVNTILNKLTKNGYEAFIVGGCLRDSIMGKTPSDFDVATSATPRQMLSVFRGMTVIPTGIKHGTITVVVNKKACEITTYRIDGIYKDGRHPDNVTFTSNLKEDLSRRDFTVNAMAYSDKTGLIDYFGGINDLNTGIIRCVGDPVKRFEEDYLRMLRAYRFAAVLDFDIAGDAVHVIKQNKHRLKDISAERIREELFKILEKGTMAKTRLFMERLGDIVLPDVYRLKGIAQDCPPHKYDVFGHTMSVYDGVPNTAVMRLSALFHDTGKAFTRTVDESTRIHFRGHPKISADIAENALKALKCDNETISAVKLLCANHGVVMDCDRVLLKQLLKRFGEKYTYMLLRLKLADAMGKNAKGMTKMLNTLLKSQEMLNDIIDKKEPYSISQLHVNGNDIISTLNIKPGKQIGDILEFLLDTVIKNPSLNTRTALMDLVRNMKFT